MEDFNSIVSFGILDNEILFLFINIFDVLGFDRRVFSTGTELDYTYNYWIDEGLFGNSINVGFFVGHFYEHEFSFYIISIFIFLVSNLIFDW